MSFNYGEGIFPGERPEKTLARRVVHCTFQRMVGLERFYAGNHVVLGGRGGDVLLLLSLGVRPQNIVVAEKNLKAYVRLVSLYPRCSVYHGDVIDVLQRTKNICTLNLDLCNKLTPKTVSLTTKALSLLPRDTAVAVTLYSSREPRDRKIVQAKVDAERQMAVPACRSRFSRSLLKGVALLNLLPPTLWAPRFIAYRSRGPALTGRIVSHGMCILVGYTAPMFGCWRDPKDIYVTSDVLASAACDLRKK